MLDYFQYIMIAVMLFLVLNIGGLCASLAMVVSRYAQRMNRKRLAAYSKVFAGLSVVEVLACFGVMMFSFLVRSSRYMYEYEIVFMVIAIGFYGIAIALIVGALVLIILHLLAIMRTIADARQIGAMIHSWSVAKDLSHD